MQLLIVHQEPEIGEALATMIRDYTGHGVEFSPNEEAARAWAGQTSGCDLLISQLATESLDGIALAASLGERFPTLQTFFLPGYPLAAQRLEIAHSKVFPEPIDGERLLEAIDRVAAEPAGPDLFHPFDLLQMFCLSGKSGGVQFVVARETATVYLRNGELRDAETPQARGLEAVYELLRWGRAEFAFDPNLSPVEQTIDVGWDAALVDVVMRDREEKALQSSASEPEISASLLPPEPDLTGQRLGTYQIGRKLTESFWDKVYQAEQTSIGRPVALHILRSSLRQDPARAREFLETASANAKIQHPAILPVYEAGEHEGTYFYAREFVVGRTLYEIKAAGRTITETTALRIVRAIAEALSHLDEQGILHAPLRPSRIFITPNDEARLADVAVAKPDMAQLAPAQHEIRMIARLLIPMTKATAIPGSGRVLALIHQMLTSGEGAIKTWSDLAAEARKLSTIVGPPTALGASKKTSMLRTVKLWGKRN